jgi:serine/threonine-protein kinase
MHPRVASALNELGIVALQRDHLDDAEAYYRRTVEIYRSVHGEEHDFLGVAMSNLASVSMARQDWAPAEAQLREVVALFARTLSEDHVNTGIARIKHGRTLLKLGRFAEAHAETQAGFDVLTGKMDPEASWLRAARHDLQVAAESLAAG